jgi:hypothetical protein
MTVRFPKEIAVLRVTQTADRLPSLARSLARPIGRGWLPLAIADVVLLLAADRTPDVGDAVDAWHDLRAVLRAELANSQPSDQSPTMVGP